MELLKNLRKDYLQFNQTLMSLFGINISDERRVVTARRTIFYSRIPKLISQNIFWGDFQDAISISFLL
jgi:hypothetical protein